MEQENAQQEQEGEEVASGITSPPRSEGNRVSRNTLWHMSRTLNPVAHLVVLSDPSVIVSQTQLSLSTRRWELAKHALLHLPAQEVGHRRDLTQRLAWWYTTGECRCQYQYGRFRHRSEPKLALIIKPMLDFLLDRILLHILGSIDGGYLSIGPNSALVNFYPDAEAWCDWHSDNELLFGNKDEHVTIISLSIGATRTFTFRHKKSKQILANIPLENGTVLVMEGHTQQVTEHSLRKGEAGSGPRFNITWRWIRHHQHHCPLNGTNTPCFIDPL